jgi:hypothetical protein
MKNTKKEKKKCNKTPKKTFNDCMVETLKIFISSIGNDKNLNGLLGGRWNNNSSNNKK